MRTGVLLPVLLIVGALVAWIHEDDRVSLRIVVLDSLGASTGNSVVPAFKAALAGHLAADGRVASFVWRRLEVDGRERSLSYPDLTSADLVVSFGAAAAERADTALLGSTTPHLFAFVPRRLALALTTPAEGRPLPRAAGIVGQLPPGAAFAIADRLLATRTGTPLRIGLLYQTIGGLEANPSPFDDIVAAASFVPIPLALEVGQGTAAMLDTVVAGAVVAAGEQQIDAFWLAFDPSAPVDRLVQAIEVQTGRPVIYAPGEAAVAAGALMSLAPEARGIGRDAAALAMHLLDEAVASQVRLRAPHRVDFSLNLETADTLGIVPPHELLELARGRLFR